MSADDDLVARADRYIEAIERSMADPRLPRSFRSEGVKAINWLREYRDRPDSRAELAQTRDRYLAAYLRDPTLIRRLHESGAILEDDRGAVAVRWDLVRAEDRKAAYSYLNALVDGYRDRSVGGRPRK